MRGLLAVALGAALVVTGAEPRAVAATEHEAAPEPLIAFASGQDAGGVYEIYTIAADGTGRTRLTNNTDVDTHPTWSPDGLRIAFESNRNHDIWVINVDGTGEASLTNTPAQILTAGTTGTFEWQPAWSPAGDQIAFVAFGDGIETTRDAGGIMVMDADGTNRVQLTQDMAVRSPSWSRDGTRILFMSSSDIWSVDVEGGAPVNLTNTPVPVFEAEPAWSPAADRIAYSGDTLGATHIRLMDPDGSNRSRLTSDPSYEYNAAWSADGERLAFERLVGSNYDVFIVNADGTGEVRLTDHPGGDILPAWQPSAAPGPSFDWTMPDRYGDDGDGDGLTDTFPPDANGGLVIEPDGWRVDFDASPGTACDTSQERTWLLDGVQILPSDPAVIAMDADACTLAYEFPAEGTYPIGLEVRDAEGVLVSAGTKDVPVQDWLVVSIGDSVASGEGNPDIPIIPSWQDRQCHRSAIAGPARAAQALEAADPRTSVTFIHLACSGATTLEGLLGPYAGQDEAAGSLLPPQVDELARLAGDREVDAVLVSIGANDVRFAGVVTLCLEQRDCTSGQRDSAASQFASDLALLPRSYDLLAYELADRGVAADRVFLTEYFDPTRNDAGAYCDRTMLADADFTSLFGSIGIIVRTRNTGRYAITAGEAAWASNTMMPALNLAGAEATTRHGWTRVGGIRDPYLTHGYCANNHWVVTFTESMARQGNQDGSLHPNAPGHELYGQRLAAGLLTGLYAGGDLDQPRLPAAP